MTIKNNIKDNSLLSMETLIEKLRSKDTENMNLSRSMILLFSIVMMIELLVFVIFPDPDSVTNKRTGGVCLVVGFGIFVWYFRYFYLKYKRINYADSVKNVLIAAEKRYRFWHISYIALIFAIVLVGVGLAYVIKDHLIETWSLDFIVPIVSLVIFSSFAIGFYVGYQKWKIEQRPLQHAARRLLEEIER